MLNDSSQGTDKKYIIRIYCNHIRSILNYGSIIYASANSTTLKNPDIIPHQVSRIIMGAFHTSFINSINVESNITPLDHGRNIPHFTYYEKLLIELKHINLYRISFFTHLGNLSNTFIKLPQKYITYKLSVIRKFNVKL